MNYDPQSSLDVQGAELLIGGGMEVDLHSTSILVDPESATVVFDPSIRSKGTSPRFLNHGANTFIFAGEDHLFTWLRQQKLPRDLFPLPIAA